MNKELKEIPIFFAIDDQYTPFLAVALKSLIENANKDYKYLIKVLHTNVQEEHMKQIKKCYLQTKMQYIKQQQKN